MACMMFTELSKKNNLNFLGRKHKFDKNMSLDPVSSSKWVIDSVMYIHIWKTLAEVF